MKLVHVWNAIAFLYSTIFFLMLFTFAGSMHYLIMDNVTTNENIRKKWNAKNIEDRNKQRISKCDKLRHVYFDKLPVSRIQRYHELRQQAIEMAKERRRQGSNSLISHSSFAGSVGGGSAAGAGGFDFEDIEIEGNLMKYVRMV